MTDTVDLAMPESLKAVGYFAHSYHSWERGLNENTNGLIRQYFPKRTNVTDVDDSDMIAVMGDLNNRPRKCLDGKTPNDALFGVKPVVTLGG